MKSISIIVAATGAVCVVACSTRPTEPEALARGPASSAAPAGPRVDLDPSQQKILSDYFLSSDADVHYVMRPRFSTNADTDHLREKGEIALHAAFAGAFSDISNAKDAAPPSLGAILGGFKKNLPNAIAENFVKTIEVYKIFGMRLQYDLLFEPIPFDASNFDAELGSNDLTIISRRGRLSGGLQLADGPNQIESVLQNVRRLKSTDRPTFVGGSVTLSAEVLKFLGTKLPMGSPLFKGTMTFRRYMVHSADVGRSSKAKSVSSDFAIKGASFSTKTETVVSTVDLIYTFDRANPKPALHRIDVYPGQILAMPTVAQKNPAVHRTGAYELTGKKYKKDFTLRVDRIALDANNRYPIDTETKFEVTRGGGGLLGVQESVILPDLMLLDFYSPVTAELVEKGDVL